MRLDKIPPDLRAVHFCPVCKTAYDSLGEANECRKRVTVHPFKVGDIVTEPAKYPRYHWHDGRDHWVHSYANPTGSPVPLPGQRLDGRGQRRFYWVVTALGTYAETRTRSPFHGHPGDHAPIYWVRSLAICNGMPEGRGGWTSQDTHEKFVIVPDPPELVVAESKALLGWKSEYLL